MIRPLIALACLQLAACTASEVPITPTRPQAADIRLLGNWRVVSVDEHGEDEDRLTVQRLPNGHLLVQDIPEQGSDPAERMEVITARIGGEHYASIIATDGEQDPRSFVLLRYEHESRNRIQVYLALPDNLAEAARRNWIRGRKESNRHLDTFFIQANSAQLREFIAAHGRSVFSEKGPLLERLK
jgi:hypothetical protein